MKILKPRGWMLCHLDQVTHVCVIKLTIIGSDNGLSPGRRQAIIRNNVGILLIWSSATHFGEILSEMHTFSSMKIYLKMSFVKWLQFYLGLNVLRWSYCCVIWKDRSQYSCRLNDIKCVFVFEIIIHATWRKYIVSQPTVLCHYLVISFLFIENQPHNKCPYYSS